MTHVLSMIMFYFIRRANIAGNISTNICLLILCSRRTIFSLVCMFCVVMSGPDLQSQTGKKDQPTGAPIDLSEIVIKGKYLPNVPTVTKQIPKHIARLTKELLDSINSLDKHRALLLPTQNYPTRIERSTLYNGFLRGEFGMFTSPELEFGYGTRWAGYDIQTTANISHSQGHVSNADFTRGGVGLNATYTSVDNGSSILSGSKTDVSLRYTTARYNLFALANPPSRSVNNVHVQAQNSGSFGAYSYSGGLSVGIMSLVQDRGSETGIETTVNDNAFSGFFALDKISDSSSYGADVSWNFRNIRNQAVNLSSIALRTDVTYDNVKLGGKAGFQIGTSSQGITQAAFIGHGFMRYHADKFFTLTADISTGLEQQTFDRFVTQNPYTRENAVVDFTRKNIEIRSGVLYHPTEYFHAAISIGYTLYGKLPYFVNDSNRTFSLRYDNASAFDGLAEIQWYPSYNDAVTARLSFLSAKVSFDSTSHVVPYMIPFGIQSEYRRSWSEKVRTAFRLGYTSARATSLSSNADIDGFVEFGIRIEYAFTQSFHSYIRLDNLTNSNIVIWDGYRERGAFIAAGIQWQF